MKQIFIILPVLIVITLCLFHCSDKSSTEPVESKPIAAFKIETVDYIVPASIGFVNQSKNADSYLWNFGDGTVSSDKNASHLYTDAGTYTVKLVAKSSSGQDSTTLDFELITPPVNIFLDKGAGGVELGEPLSKAIKIYGNNFEESKNTSAGKFSWWIYFPERGIDFVTEFVADEQSKMSAEIREIMVQSPFKGTTDKGIGIGSSRKKVEAQYWYGVYTTGKLYYRVAPRTSINFSTSSSNSVDSIWMYK